MSTAHPIVTLEIRDVFTAMVRNAEALKRLLIMHETPTLDAESNAHFQELLDEIGARTTQHTERIGHLILSAHLDRRVLPYERRANADRRQAQAADHRDSPMR